MPVKTKATPGEKVRIAQLCDSGRLSQGQAAEQMGVSKITIQSWLARYQEQGAVSFARSEGNQSYSPDLKLKAVTGYLSGKGSQLVLAEKYGLRSKTQLQRWIKMYKEGRDFGQKKSEGSRMTTSKKIQRKNVLPLLRIAWRTATTIQRLQGNTMSAISRSTPG